MKFFLVLAAAVACTVAAPPNYSKSEYTEYKTADADAPVVNSEYESSPEGNFRFGYETGNGIYAQAEGVVKNPNSENAALVVSGSVRYTAPDGTPVELTYTADEDGFHPSGLHLPVGPPTPDAILRSLEYLKTHAAPVDETYPAVKNYQPTSTYQATPTYQAAPSYQVAPVPPKRF